MVVAVRAEAVITAQNKLRPGLAASARELERFRGQQSKAMSIFESTAARAMATVGAALAGYSIRQQLAEAQRRFAEVDRTMSRIGITGDATVEQTRKGTAELRNLARDTATLFDPAQKGLDAITASGRDFGDAMKMMPSVLRTAQASGAGVEDIANSSTALLDHMKISIEGLQEAQDTLAMGGKLGKFELKDMARYLPSMLPAFKALGQSGQGGLRNLVAMLQVIRGGTGSAEEAASSAQNIFAKMESEETTKRFQKFGIDLRKEMTKARKEGKNLLDVFLELSNKALKGDLSKLPQLFSDMEVQRGMRPLLGDMQKIVELREKLAGSKGTIDADFKRITGDAQANLDRFAEAGDRAKTALGGLASELGSARLKLGADNLDRVAQAMERAAEAVRDKGVKQAIADMASAAVKQVGSDMDEHRQNWIRIEDTATLGNVSARNSERQRYQELIARDPKTLTRSEVAELYMLRRKGAAKVAEPLSESETGAWSRDQMARLGEMPAPLTSASPEFAAIIEAAREARRGKAFSGLSGGSEFPTSPVKSKPGSVQPPQRPGDLAGGGMVPVAPLDDVKTKTEAVATTFGLLGPAAQEAGSSISTGFTAAEGSVDRLRAKVAALKQEIGSIRAPSLSFGGLGGLNTGRQGAE